MRVLLDTNVVISSEPGRYEDIEEVSPDCLKLSAAASRHGHTLLVHPSIVDEIAHDGNIDRRRTREVLLDRYTELSDPPSPPARVVAAYPRLAPETHDWYDHLLLGCVAADAAHVLVTQDEKILRRARQLGLSNRVQSVPDALAMLDELAGTRTQFLPSVIKRPLYALDLAAPFFDSLRSDYREFSEWFRAKSREGREALVVDGPNGQIAGICIIKDRPDDDIGSGGRLIKVSTFKVDDAFKGNRYGELLLKALFNETVGSGDGVWLTVFPKQAELISLLESFGFRRHNDTPRGEGRYLKRFTPPPGAPTLSPLEHHIAYGPPALQVQEDQTFIIPIQPRFHQRLFPDAPQGQMGLIPPAGHGNALRKAYLCHANLRTARPGATILFYRSEDAQAVTAAGVLEDSLVSRDPEEIMAFVGSRTVYSAGQIEEMANASTILAFLFRQDRFLEPPITLDELVEARALSRAPQTTISISPEGIPWLAARLDA